MTSTIFLGGLPRSGSTLLTNLLGQSESIAVEGTSGLAALIHSMREVYTRREEFSSNNTEVIKARMANCIVNSISGWSLSKEPYYVDKGRGWLRMLELLNRLYDRPTKVIVPIRDLRGVFASMEKLYRNNNLNIDPVNLVGDKEGLTVDARFSNWQSSLPIGTAIGDLKDIVDRKIDNNVFYVRMEDLTDNPQKIINNLCAYLQIKSYDITFPIINQAKENDKLYGIAGLHDTEESSILPCSTDYEDILGNTICDEIVRGYSWFYNKFYPELIQSKS